MSNVPSSHIATLPSDCSSSAVLPTMPICSLSLNFPNDCVVFRRQLPINLDGSTHSDASSKGKAPLHTFSRVVKLRVGGLSGSHFCRTRSGHHIHLVSSNFEPGSQITPLPRLCLLSLTCLLWPSLALFYSIWFKLKPKEIGLRLNAVLTMWTWVIGGFYLSSLLFMTGGMFGWKDLGCWWS